MTKDDPKQKLEHLLNDILRTHPDLSCTTIRNFPGKCDFRINNRKLETVTKWSKQLSADELDMETVQSEVRRLIEQAGWEFESVVSKERTTPWDLEQLIQVILILVKDSGLDFIRLIAVSPNEGHDFIEVNSETFQSDLEEMIQNQMLPLGLLGWDIRDDSVQAKSILLPWHRENHILTDVFRRLCEMGVESVEKEFKKQIQ
jgi:hypothetical protein